jgi:hypothetical protein
VSYLIGETEFRTKSEITDKCRSILSDNQDGIHISVDQCAFLFELFRFHDEWDIKTEQGVIGISTQTTEHGTRCFILVRKDGSNIDISFNRSIKMIPTGRTKNLLPQYLLDYKAAARTAIKPQICEFRDKSLSQSLVCPYIGVNLSRENCAVDHISPNTFDRLLFDFSILNKIKPVHVEVRSKNGVVAEFVDKQLELDWQIYHQATATLRTISRIGNLQLPKIVVPWKNLM